MTNSREEISSIIVFFVITLILLPNAICGVILVPILFRQLSMNDLFPVCLCDMLILTFCLYEVVSPIWSINAYNTIDCAFRMLMFTLIYLFARFKIRSEFQLKLIVIGANMVIFIICLITIMQYIIHHIAFSEAGFENMAELKPFYRPIYQPVNKWTTFLLCLFPYAVVPYLYCETKTSSLYLVNILLLFVSILVCFSKGSYIALLCFLGGFLVYGGCK